MILKTTILAVAVCEALCLLGVGGGDKVAGPVGSKNRNTERRPKDPFPVITAASNASDQIETAPVKAADYPAPITRYGR